MTKNDKQPKAKYKMLTEEDIKIIKADPAGLADYVVATKIKSSRKSALILALILAVATFGAGVMVGTTIAKNSIPNNVVQVLVNDKEVESGK